MRVQPCRAWVGGGREKSAGNAGEASRGPQVADMQDAHGDGSEALTGGQPVGAGRGICEGRRWGSTPRFSSFRAPGYAPPSGGHSPASPPSSATGEDRREFINRPGQ